MTGYRFNRRYLFVGGGVRPDMWFEVGHDQAQPPVTMTIVLEEANWPAGNQAAKTLPAERIVYYRHRRPKSLESGIDEFSRELRALAPKRDRGPDRG